MKAADYFLWLISIHVATCVQGQRLEEEETNDDAIYCNITVRGGPAGPGRDCTFPFKIGNRQFDRCTTAFEGDKRPWCPTETDENGDYNFGSRKWGYCDPRCPFVTAAGETVTGTTAAPTLLTSKPRATRSTYKTAITTTTSTLPTVSWKGRVDRQDGHNSFSGLWLPRSGYRECGFTLDFGYVVGGSMAKRGEFPFAALLGYKDGDSDDGGGISYRCGGSLINRLYVLTAAHCHSLQQTASGVRGGVVEVVLGEFDTTTDPDCESCRPVQRFAPSKVIVHEAWLAAGGRGDSDIALVRLDRPAVIASIEHNQEVIAPVCLDGFPTEDQAEIWVVGWGRTTTKDDDELGNRQSPRRRQGEESAIGSTVPQKLQVPLVKSARCKSYFSELTGKQLCAGGEEGKDSCNGDSGGPLIARASPDSPMFLVGIVSSGTRECGVGQPGIYTRVSVFKDWIVENLEP